MTNSPFSKYMGVFNVIFDQDSNDCQLFIIFEVVVSHQILIFLNTWSKKVKLFEQNSIKWWKNLKCFDFFHDPPNIGLWSRLISSLKISSLWTSEFVSAWIYRRTNKRNQTKSFVFPHQPKSNLTHTVLKRSNQQENDLRRLSDERTDRSEWKVQFALLLTYTSNFNSVAHTVLEVSYL